MANQCVFNDCYEHNHVRLIEFELTEETMLRGQVNVRGSLF